MLLQEAIDHTLQQLARQGSETLESATSCFSALSEYLWQYSDLFQEEEEPEEERLEEWEESLNQHMDQLMQGDTEPAPPDLRDTPLTALHSDHLHDFVGWYMLRELGPDSVQVEQWLQLLRDWFNQLGEKGWITGECRASFLAILNDLQPEAIRVAKAARLLLHHVRLGGGVPPRLRGQRFAQFVEGHGRVAALTERSLCLHFDNRPTEVGPVAIPAAVAALLREGDVIDVELGLRGDLWLMVDVGPVYPCGVYVEAEEFEGLEKLT